MGAVVRGALSLACLLACTDAGAVRVVTSAFAGMITEVSDPTLVLDGSVAAGLPFDGSYTFDLDEPDAQFSPYQADPDLGLYQFAREPYGVWLELGDHPIFLWALNLRFSNDILDTVGYDQFLLESSEIDALPPGNPLSQVDGASIRWELRTCPNGIPCPVGSDPLASDALLRVPPELGSWPINQFDFVATSGWYCPPRNDVCVRDELFSARGVVTWVPETSAAWQTVAAGIALDLLCAARARRGAGGRGVVP